MYVGLYVMSRRIVMNYSYLLFLYTHIKFQRFLRHSSFSEKLASKVNAGGVESESLACAEESRCSQHTQLALSGKDADRSFVKPAVTHQRNYSPRPNQHSPQTPAFSLDRFQSPRWLLDDEQWQQFRHPQNTIFLKKSTPSWKVPCRPSGYWSVWNGGYRGTRWMIYENFNAEVSTEYQATSEQCSKPSLGSLGGFHFGYWLI